MNAVKPDCGNARTTTQRAFCSSAHSARGRPESNRENVRRYVTMVSCLETSRRSDGPWLPDNSRSQGNAQQWELRPPPSSNPHSPCMGFVLYLAFYFGYSMIYHVYL